MSGAEVAGLALGVIALASLFKSCVELLEWFELGKNYHTDYRLACTKIRVLSKRLSVWGRHVQILNRGHEHPFLFNSATCDIVRDSLKSLESLLSDTDGLRRRYDLTTATHPSIGTKSPATSTKLAFWSLQIRRRTTWSIRDKAKFDRFISDVSFFMGTLEKVTEKVDDFHAEKGTIDGMAMVRKPTTRTSDALALRHETKQQGEYLQVSDVGDEPGAEVSAVEQHGSNEAASNEEVGTRAEINDSRQTSSDDAIVLQGTSGEYGGHATINGSVQDNKDRSKGVQGAIGKDSFATLMSRK